MSRRLSAACLAAACLAAAAAASAATFQVTVTSTPDGAFLPRTVTIRVGDTVRWTNVDGLHNVVADDGTWTSGPPAVAPWTFSRTFTTAGTFGYYCNLHGSPGVGMFGTVVVLDSIELGHGSQITEDLNGAPDRYRIGQKAYSSYEVVVDPVAGNPALTLSRVDGSGTLDPARLAAQHDRHVAEPALDRTRPPPTSTPSASASATRRAGRRAPRATSTLLRAYETTLAIPRYNQTGTQSTVIVLQNPTSYTIAGTVYFWNARGRAGELGACSRSPPRARSCWPPAPSRACRARPGRITIAHNARYGDLTGKAVAIEPATGFTFDTPAVSRAR